MRFRVFAVWPLVVIAAAGLMLGGCIKLKQDTVVMPDGSGKMTIRIGFNAKAVKEAAAGMGQGEATEGMDKPTDMDLSDLEDFEGFVAFAAPEKEVSADGWEWVKITGYFEDVNKVVMYDDEEAEGKRVKQLWYSFEKKDGGYVLTAHSQYSDFEEMGQLDDMGADTADMPPEMKKMVEGIQKAVEEAFKDFEFSHAFTMPGEVTAAEGVTSKEGRVATYAVTRKDLENPAAAKAFAQEKVFRVECGPSAVSEADLAAFKAEMAKAREEWAKIKAEAEKNAPPPEKDTGDEDGGMEEEGGGGE